MNLRDRPTVLFLNDNQDYALKFDTDKQKVVVERYVEGDKWFKFDLDRVVNPAVDCKCDCNLSV